MVLIVLFSDVSDSGIESDPSPLYIVETPDQGRSSSSSGDEPPPPKVPAPASIRLVAEEVKAQVE